jgi:hypothetical protein
MPEPELKLLGAGAPGLDDSMLRARDREEYQQYLTLLIKNKEMRESYGRKLREEILKRHTSKGWLDSLDQAYIGAASQDHAGCFLSKEDRFTFDSLTGALRNLYSSVSFSARTLIRHFIGRLPYIKRLQISLRLAGLGLQLCFLNLIPPPFDKALHSSGRLVKRSIHRLARLVAKA